MSTEIAIIIVNYRTAELTLDCLKSLEAEVGSSTRVVIVDNASGDGSAERIEQSIAQRGYSWAELVRSPINGGFASGNNLGIRSVEAAAYLLLNSDTIVQPGALAGLRAALRARPDAGIIGPGLLNASGEHDDSVFRAPPPAAEFARAAQSGVIEWIFPQLKPSFPASLQPIEADWLGFACVLIRKEVIEQVGGLDEGYFMYFEDIDYCRRVRAAGWKVLCWPSAKVIHLLGGSSGVTTQSKLQKRGPRYYYEARARYFATYYGRTGLWRANGYWYLGRALAFAREVVGRSKATHREREALDIWINALTPMRESSMRRGQAA